MHLKEQLPQCVGHSMESGTPWSPDEPIKILLVEDHPLVRQGMKMLLSYKSRFHVCGEAETAAEGLTRVAEQNPDLAIVDINLHDSSGIELTKNIRASFRAISVLVVSMHDEDVYADLALRAGAFGYLMKDEPADNLIAAIDTVMRGEIFLSDRIKSRFLQRLASEPKEAFASPIDRLSNREREVMKLIGQGYATSEIAALLNLSVKTIDSYREHLKVKLQFANGAELLRYSIQWVKSGAADTTVTCSPN